MSNVKNFFVSTVKPPKAVYGSIASSQALPMAINAPGEFINLDPGTLTHYDADGAINWYVIATDILTSTSGTPRIAGYWWDTVDDRLYVLAIEGLTGATDRAQLAWLNLTTGGTVTKLGGVFTLTSGKFEYDYGGLFRESQGSGDFTYRSGPGQLNEAVIPSIGGSATEVLDIRFNGRPAVKLSYKTPNGNYAGQFYFETDSNTYSNVRLAGSNGTVLAVLGVPKMGAANHTTKIIQWNNDIAFLGTQSGYSFHGPQLFDKTDFDRFIDELAELNGVA